jgi:hypothetical protein
MRLRLVCCEILYREISLLVAGSPHTCDVQFLPKGLHDLGTEKMVPRLQEQVDAACEAGCDAVLLGYGLCNNGTVGLEGEERFREMAREEAERAGRSFAEIEGALELLRKLVYGEWDEEFLVLQPGESVAASYDDDVVRVG